MVQFRKFKIFVLKVCYRVVFFVLSKVFFFVFFTKKIYFLKVKELKLVVFKRASLFYLLFNLFLHYSFC